MIVFILLVVLCVLLFKWRAFNRNDSYSKVQFIEPKFDEFLKLYAEEPGRWILKKDRIIFNKNYRSSNLQVQFSFIDYLRYCVFFAKCNHLSKKDKAQKDKEERESALNALREETWRGKK